MTSRPDQVGDHNDHIGTGGGEALREVQPGPLARREIVGEVSVLQVVHDDADAAQATREQRRAEMVREEHGIGGEPGIEARALFGDEARAAATALDDALAPLADERPRQLVAGGARELSRGPGFDEPVEQVVEHRLGVADPPGEHEMTHHRKPERRRDKGRALGAAGVVDPDRRLRRPQLGAHCAVPGAPSVRRDWPECTGARACSTRDVIVDARRSWHLLGLFTGGAPRSGRGPPRCRRRRCGSRRGWA